MANTATALTPIDILIGKTGKGGLVVPYVVVFDTTASDLTVHTPASDTYAAIIGIQYAEASAHTFTVKSNTTTLVAYEMPANSGKYSELGKIVVAAKKGESLVIRADTAVISSMLLYVAEFKYLIL